MRPLLAAVLDVVAVVAFVLAGRRTHAGGVDVAGTAQTAWPFLVALGVGWLVSRAWRRPTALLRTGVPVWLITLVGGLALRRATGGGTAAAFVIVATVVLAALLLGWRGIAQLRVRR
jgi:hypothetical protein